MVSLIIKKGSGIIFIQFKKLYRKRRHFKMSDCIFCKIISGDIPSATVYEDDEFKAILDRFPSNKGHVLIMPKTHVANIFEIDPDMAGRLFKLAAKIAPVMKETFGFENMNVIQNNGPIAGQTVNHFHLHLIPRY